MALLFYPKYFSPGKQINVYLIVPPIQFATASCNLGKLFVVKYKCKAWGTGKVVVGEKGPRPGA